MRITMSCLALFVAFAGCKGDGSAGSAGGASPAEPALGRNQVAIDKAVLHGLCQVALLPASGGTGRLHVSSLVPDKGNPIPWIILDTQHVQDHESAKTYAEWVRIGMEGPPGNAACLDPYAPPPVITAIVETGVDVDKAGFWVLVGSKGKFELEFAEVAGTEQARARAIEMLVEYGDNKLRWSGAGAPTEWTDALQAHARQE